MFSLSVLSEGNMEIVTNQLSYPQKILDTLLIYTIEIMKMSTSNSVSLGYV